MSDFYGEMADMARELMGEFSQGLVTVRRTETESERPPDLPIWEVWEPETTIRLYRLDAVVRPVPTKYVDGTTIRASDFQIVASDRMTLYSVDGVPAEPVEAPFDVDLAETIEIDGRAVTILETIRTPGAGTAIVHKFIARV